MALGGDLRVVVGALAGVGLGGVVLLTGLPALAPVERTASVPAKAASEPVPASEEAPQEAAPVPRFDTVRMAPDGSGLVAGQAEPGAMVSVLADDEVTAEVMADANGRFVAFLDLPASAQPRALSLRDEAGTVSDETVIVAPTGNGAVVAGSMEAEPASSAATMLAEGQGAAPAPGAVEAGLPADQPESRLALVEEVPLSPDAGEGPASGGATEQVASVEPAPPGVGAQVAPTSPDVAGSGVAPAGDVAPEPPVASAVAGPAPASPDLQPYGGAGPEVDDDPGGLAAPEGTAPGQAAVLVSDAEGVRVLQPPLAPGEDAEVLSTVALDAIGYGGDGEVLLSGRATGQGTVRLYLDNARVADVPVGPDGQWSATLSGSEQGDYTLRVDQIDGAGEVVSRIETPFRREARADLAAAMAQSQKPGQTIAVRTVQPGNTLWAIARDRYGEPLMYVRVFELNRDRIRDPDLIYPGQVFVLPATDGR